MATQTQNIKDHEDRRQYTFYLPKNLIDSVEEQCRNVGISKNNYIEKFLSELQGYQTPAVTIRNHIKVIDLYVTADLERAQVEYDKLAAEKVLNDYKDLDKKADLQQMHSIAIKELTKYRNMKKSIDIINDKLDYL